MASLSGVGARCCRDGQADGARGAVGGTEAMAQLALQRADRQQVLRRPRVLVGDAGEARRACTVTWSARSRPAPSPRDSGTSIRTIPAHGLAWRAGRGDPDVGRVALAREEQRRALAGCQLRDARVQLEPTGAAAGAS